VKGRIKRQQAQAAAARMAEQRSAATAGQPDPTCPLCDRPIPAAQRDAHHLVPKSRGGVHTVWLHRICHRQVHALFTETELARQLHQAEALRAHPDMQRFLEWVRRKPNDFFERTRKSERLKG
jgi:5-methylcytosine-specific restriction endonuclease McrA